MISALFLIVGIRSTTNLKTYEQAKNFFNSANARSPPEEYLKEKPETFICNLFSFHLV